MTASILSIDDVWPMTKVFHNGTLGRVERVTRHEVVASFGEEQKVFPIDREGRVAGLVKPESKAREESRSRVKSIMDKAKGMAREARSDVKTLPPWRRKREVEE